MLTELAPLVAGKRDRRGGCRASARAASRHHGRPACRIAIYGSMYRSRAGLDYYTGVVFETFLTELPQLGSVCSGGRYDNLAELYTNQELPGVGASLGLDRLLAGMEELGMIDKVGTPAEVFIALLFRRATAQVSAACGASAQGGLRRRGLSRAQETRSTV